MNSIVIETHELTKEYSGISCVDKVNLNIRKGRIYGLLGRNGAGKTTTMKMIVGLLKPTSGNVFVFGEDMEEKKAELLPRIGAMIEKPGFYSNLSAAENLDIFRRLRKIDDKDVIKSALEQVDLPYNSRKKFSEFSLGMKQRLAIANAIMHDPEILILDEPTNGLDPIGIAEMRSFIKNLCKDREKTIFISSHILSEIELLADDIGIIDKGVLYEETSKDSLLDKRRKCIRIRVSDAGQAERICAGMLASGEYQMTSDEELLVFRKDVDVESLVKNLVMGGIGIGNVIPVEETLEDYFIRVTGENRSGSTDQG